MREGKREREREKKTFDRIEIFRSGSGVSRSLGLVNRFAGVIGDVSGDIFGDNRDCGDGCADNPSDVTVRCNLRRDTLPSCSTSEESVGSSSSLSPFSLFGDGGAFVRLIRSLSTIQSTDRGKIGT